MPSSSSSRQPDMKADWLSMVNAEARIGYELGIHYARDLAQLERLGRHVRVPPLAARTRRRLSGLARRQRFTGRPAGGSRGAVPGPAHLSLERQLWMGGRIQPGAAHRPP